MWKRSNSVPRAGWSLRSGWPAQLRGIMMRNRFGWPSNFTPNRSQTSRSYQLALTNTSTTLGSDGCSPLSATFTRKSLFRSNDIRW
jgi:hypothetical protein